MCATVFARPAARVLDTATSNPSHASATAIAAPSPCDAPVTNAVGRRVSGCVAIVLELLAAPSADPGHCAQHFTHRCGIGLRQPLRHCRVIEQHAGGE